MREYWLNVKDHERYEISNYGNVRNKKSGRILKPQMNREGGYQRVNIDGKYEYVSRIMARSFFEVEDDDFVVRYSDGNKTNNFLPNLEIKRR